MAVPPAATPRSPGSFGVFLFDAMRALQREHGDAWGRVCAALHGRRVTVAVDAEIVPLSFDATSVTFLPFAARAHVTLHTDRATIDGLIDGGLSLMDAVGQNRLGLAGRPDDVVRFHDGLMAWLHGAVRSPSFPELLRGFRTGPGEDET